MIPALLASFTAKYPDVVCELEVGSRTALWPMLARHEVDVVVAGRPPTDLRQINVRAISPNVLVVVGPPELAQSFVPAEATWLLRESGSGTRATTAMLLSELEISPPQMVLGSHGAVVAGAIAGLGVTLVHRQAVKKELESGVLIELPVPGTPLDRPWHVVTHLHCTGPLSY
ncbi:lysR substrate binding domain protein [Mycobacterium xenopi 4042]|uniref:LysR substrate binding domain protein n=1 Tax=Mycobacterium xenopi 4042 TaxID=1299334 RepID=X7ZX84_MYCXE|nr:lysR substrate binding domain protein [Mycobacterium xenopi 4042]